MSLIIYFMTNEVKRWWEQAESDLKAAQDSITTNHYDCLGGKILQWLEKKL